MPELVNPAQEPQTFSQSRAVFRILISFWGRMSGSKAVVAKKNVDFTDSVRFNGQDPGSTV